MVLIVFELLIFVVAGLLHIFGLHLLMKCPNAMGINQRYYLMSLSVSEVLLSVGHIIMKVTQTYFQTETENDWYHIIVIFHFDGLWIVNMYMILFFTFDRFLSIYLNIKYKPIITKRRTLMIISAIWGLSGVMTIIFISLHIAIHIDYLKFSFSYIFPVNDTLVVVNAVIVYGYIYNRSFRKPTLQRSSSTNQRNQRRNTNRQKFLIPLLILITFVLLIYIPDAIIFIHIKVFNNSPVWLDRASSIIYSIAFLSDVSIYIFFNPTLRRRICFKRKLNGIRNHTRNIAHVNTHSM